MEMILLVALAAGALWLMTSRQRKQQKAAEDFRQHLVAGEKVMTHSGMVATVVEVADGLITLESETGERTQWILAAVARKYEPVVPAAEEPSDEDDETADDEYEDEDVEYDDDEYDEDDDEDDLDVEVPDDVSSLTDPAETDHVSDATETGTDEPPAATGTASDIK